MRGGGRGGGGEEERRSAGTVPGALREGAVPTEGLPQIKHRHTLQMLCDVSQARRVPVRGWVPGAAAVGKDSR